MKKKFAALLLALATTAACASSALALPLPKDYAYGALAGMCQDGEGILIADTYNKVVWRVENDVVVRTAGQIGVLNVNSEPIGDYVDGTAETALFMEPWAIAPFLSGYAITDASANVVRYYDGTAVRTAVGSGKAEFKAGVGTAAGFNHPTGLAAGPDGSLFVADTGNGCIRTVSNKGRVETWFSGLSEPTGICYVDGSLYVAETGADRVVKITKGALTVIAGGEHGYVDGPVAKSCFREPQGVAVAADGTVYVADTGNNAVRRIKDGRVTTMAVNNDTPEPPVQPRGLLLKDDSLLVTDIVACPMLALSTAAPVYNDVAAESVFAPYVAAGTERGLTTGTAAGVFSPNTPVTRAQFVTMLGRMHHSTDGDVVINGDAVFNDVAADAWCASTVSWAADNQLVQGNNGAFVPNSGITRQALVTILYRYAQQNGYSTSARGDLNKFQDVDQVSDYARDALAWGVASGVISGDASGNLLPTGTATRAQTVKILVSFMDSMGI